MIALWYEIDMLYLYSVFINKVNNFINRYHKHIVCWLQNVSNNLLPFCFKQVKQWTRLWKHELKMTYI